MVEGPNDFDISRMEVLASLKFHQMIYMAMLYISERSETDRNSPHEWLRAYVRRVGIGLKVMVEVMNIYPNLVNPDKPGGVRSPNTYRYCYPHSRWVVKHEILSRVVIFSKKWKGTICSFFAENAGSQSGQTPGYKCIIQRDLCVILTIILI